MQGSAFFDSPLFRKATPYALYFLALAEGLTILLTGRADGLFPMPTPGTDQLSMLHAAAGLCQGHLPPESYRYSSAYTAFLALLIQLCNGDLLAMRALQIAVCALIPVVIYKAGLKFRFGREASLAGALLYCLYGPSQLIAVDFLRAAPLGLCFIFLLYLFALAIFRSKPFLFGIAGFVAALCVLGRENFIPVVLLPSIFLLHGGVRRRVG